MAQCDAGYTSLIVMSRTASGADAGAEHRRPGKPGEDGPLGRLPCEADRDVDGLDIAGLRLVGDEDDAVEPARTEHRDRFGSSAHRQ